MTQRIAVLIITAIFFVGLIFADDSEQWVLAASEFTGVDLPDLYARYNTAVPKLFLLQLDKNLQRRIKTDESRARSITALSEKKLTLLKERANLMHKRDLALLAPKTPAEKTKQVNTINKEIKKKEHEIEILTARIKTAAMRVDTSEPVLPVRLWKNGEELFTPSPQVSLIQSLKSQKINALLTGEVKDIAGYMVIHVYIKTGLKDYPDFEFTHAGKYADVTDVVEILAGQIQTTIQNTAAARILFEVNPPSAQIYIDQEAVKDSSKLYHLFTGIYTVTVEANGFQSAQKVISVEEKKQYRMRINLIKSDTVDLSFGLTNPFDDLFHKGISQGEAPVVVGIEKKETIIEVDNNGVQTFLLFSPDMLKKLKETDMIAARFASHTAVLQKQIEKQRSILYWSLAGFYISLPIMMILKSTADDRSHALQSGAISNTEKNQNLVRNLNISTYVFQGVAVTLGINYLVQLIRYLVISDRVIPRTVDLNHEAQ